MKSSLVSYGNRRKIAGFLFVLPVVLYFVVLYYVPLATSFRYSFLEVLPKGKTQLAGLKTYQWVLADPLFRRALVNNLYFDTPDMRFYWDTKHRRLNRFKPRLRARTASRHHRHGTCQRIRMAA